MGLRDIEPIIEEHNRQLVLVETFGHLAPINNHTYTGRIVYTCGCFDSGDLNPTPIFCKLKGLDSSPWFYEAIHAWLQALPETFKKIGCVYEWKGLFRNYEFLGNIRLLIDTNKS